MEIRKKICNMTANGLDKVYLKEEDLDMVINNNSQFVEYKDCCDSYKKKHPKCLGYYCGVAIYKHL